MHRFEIINNYSPYDTIYMFHYIYKKIYIDMYINKQTIFLAIAYFDVCEAVRRSLSPTCAREVNLALYRSVPWSARNKKNAVFYGNVIRLWEHKVKRYHAVKHHLNLINYLISVMCIFVSELTGLITKGI